MKLRLQVLLSFRAVSHDFFSHVLSEKYAFPPRNSPMVTPRVAAPLPHVIDFDIIAELVPQHA